MELKNAVAVCLIALVSATLVVLVARALDSQAAAQLEPQLAQIAEELRALRQQGGISTDSDGATTDAAVGDGLVVYYFHRNFRCPTCRAIESQTKALLDAEFARQLAAGQLVWKVLNYEKPIGKSLGAKFDVVDPVVVLARMENGRMVDSRRLDQVMALVSDESAFAKYVRGEIEGMLALAEPSGAAPVAGPVPTTEDAPVDLSTAPLP
ncbi:MAG TPA: nitrophenyl compound nitroreductase subunit ArsF family protein [Thermoguttaceae bacterium]|nr:nitrophenyl compound nitroreductase subunit ArsF family protein [Thermoguttaceae bacterium]